LVMCLENVVDRGSLMRKLGILLIIVVCAALT